MGRTIHCGEPATPRYGHIIDSSEFTYPNTVTYMCEQGYVLQGDAILRCESNGQWSSSPPKCQPADGPFPWWVLVIVVVIFLSMATYVMAKCFLKYCGDGDEDPVPAEVEERQSLQGADDRRAHNEGGDKQNGGAGDVTMVTPLDLGDR